MNKIASMFHLMERHVPTLDFYIVRKESVEKDVRAVFHPTERGWVIRCGQEPDIRGKPERGMPWRVCSTQEDIIETVKDFYRYLPQFYYVFFHPQRDMVKSGNLLIDGRLVLVEAVMGWPEGLSHGKEDPQAAYEFRVPTLFSEPSQIRGKDSLLSPEELFRIGAQIERNLRYGELSLTHPVCVEWSINRFGQPSAHDIQVH